MRKASVVTDEMKREAEEKVKKTLEKWFYSTSTGRYSLNEDAVAALQNVPGTGYAGFYQEANKKEGENEETLTTWGLEGLTFDIYKTNSIAAYLDVQNDEAATPEAKVKDAEAVVQLIAKVITRQGKIVECFKASVKNLDNPENSSVSAIFDIIDSVIEAMNVKALEDKVTRRSNVYGGTMSDARKKQHELAVQNYTTRAAMLSLDDLQRLVVEIVTSIIHERSFTARAKSLLPRGINSVVQPILPRKSSSFIDVDLSNYDLPSSKQINRASVKKVSTCNGVQRGLPPTPTKKGEVSPGNESTLPRVLNETRPLQYPTKKKSVGLPPRPSKESMAAFKNSNTQNLQDALKRVSARQQSERTVNSVTPAHNNIGAKRVSFADMQTQTEPKQTAGAGAELLKVLERARRRSEAGPSGGL